MLQSAQEEKNPNQVNYTTIVCCKLRDNNQPHRHKHTVSEGQKHLETQTTPTTATKYKKIEHKHKTLPQNLDLTPETQRQKFKSLVLIPLNEI